MTSTAETPCRVLAVVGLCISGKSEVVNYLVERYGLPKIYFGDHVFRELDKLGQPHDQAHEKPMREKLRREQGMGVMAKLALPDIEAALEKSAVVVVESLYSYSEQQVLEEKFGDELKVVAVHSDRHLRYQRGEQRPHRPLTAEGIDQRDRAEVDNLEKAQPIALADFHILNNGTLGDLNKAVDQIVSKLGITS